MGKPVSQIKPNCTDLWCEACANATLAENAAAFTAVGFEQAAAIIMQRAASHFTSKDDKTAAILRALASDMSVQAVHHRAHQATLQKATVECEGLGRA